MDSRDKLSAGFALFLVLLFSQGAVAMIFTGGADPIEDHGWPSGSVRLANLPTRVSWWAGPPFGTGSMYEFQYDCETAEEFNEALKVFAGINASKLELVVHNGPKPGGWPEGNEKTDWTFTVWNPSDWDSLRNRSQNKKFKLKREPVPAPRIDLYTHAKGIMWKDVVVPDKVLVSDTRPGSIDPKYAGAGLIDMKVVDISTGKGICGMEVTLRHTGSEEAEVISKVTNPAGECRIPNIPSGYYEIIVEGYQSVPRKATFNNQVPTYEQITMPMAIKSKLAGVVTDTDGVPVEGVKMVSREFIGVDGEPYPVDEKVVSLSDSKARFEIIGVAAGYCKLRCSDKKWHGTNSIFDWYPVPGDDVKIVVESTATIRGTITTMEGKAPQGTINFSIEPAEGEKIGRWGYGGYVPKDGKYEITGIPPDEYRVTAKPNPSPGKYQADERTMKIEGGKTYTIDIVLKPRK